MSKMGIRTIVQVLFLDIRKDTQHERLLAFVQAARQHLQTAGVNSSSSHTVHVRDQFAISCMHCCCQERSYAETLKVRLAIRFLVQLNTSQHPEHVWGSVSQV